MAERNILHHSHLDKFAKYLSRHGWNIQDTKDYFEVLRATKNGKRPIIIYRRSGEHQHYSIDSRDVGIVRAFIREIKEGAEDDNT